MRPRFSQNFLVNLGAARSIVSKLELNLQDFVLEIGPGRGILTEILMENSVHLTAVEIDSELAENLRRRWPGDDHLKVVTSDFLETDLDSLIDPSSRPVKIVGNLPYAVTSPIFQKVLAWDGWSCAVFMVQKEVAERICAKPGGKDYGILTVSVQSRASVEKVMDVSKNSFRPVPEVTSSVLRLAPLENPAFAPEEEEKFFKTVKAAFSQRRKMAANSISKGLGMEADKVRETLKASGLDVQTRAERISVEEFVRLARILYNS